MNKFKIAGLVATLTSLFACTPSTPPKPVKTGYLKSDITQTELMNAANFKRYYYLCNDLETGESVALATYFPLSLESRQKENFGFYFQLNGGKAEPFDHLENKAINARGTRFEVSYRSYNPIQGKPIDLIARETRSTYYKNHNGTKTPWLECSEG